MRTQTEQRCWGKHRGLIVSASGWTPTALKPPIVSNRQNEQLSAVFCKYVDGFIQTSEGNRPVLQSASVRGVSVPFRFGWESHLWHNLQLLCHRGWQLKQGSRLVDRTARWVMTLSYWHLLTRTKPPYSVTSQLNGLQTHQTGLTIPPN